MKPKAIDIHTHVEFAGAFEILKKRYTEEEIFERFVVSATGRRSAELNRGIVAGIRDALRDPQKKIRDMDEAGIGFSVLSSTPFAFFYEVEDDLAVELARLQNDKLAEMVKKYPDRFAAMRGRSRIPFRSFICAFQEESAMPPETSADGAPRGALTVRISAMPADTNANGDIFGGWVLSRMDQAGGIAGVERARGRVVTIAVEAMTFIRPVKVGDVLEVYTDIESIGRTSMKIHVEAWARRFETHHEEKVTDATFTFVAIDKNGKPRPIPKEDA